jgi:hypothetical protein
MRLTVLMIAAVATLLLATPAFADDFATNRDIEAAVDGYLASAGDDASLVGGPGSAGYDAGFWIRGGDFLLRINATIQARFESWDWDDEDAAAPVYLDSPFGWAGDTSGFSLPRATLKFSGEAPCNICWYMELEFGHWGRNVSDGFAGGGPVRSEEEDNLGPFFLFQSFNFDNTREAWIEWCYCPVFNVRMGQVLLPTTRQMMTAPELQQFADISLASSWTGWFLPGYTTRNRDHGLLVHGAFGCNEEWSYVVSVTNGDGGDSIRNVLDHRTSDNLAYGARLNWAFLAPIGYEEGALRQQTCQWYGEVGAWAFYYADRVDKGHDTVADFLAYGADVALGYGGFSFTAAYSLFSIDAGSESFDQSAWLAQLGYLFPGTAWEIAARASGYSEDVFIDGDVTEFAFAINYYLNGHGNKLTLDVSFVNVDQAFLLPDFGAGYPFFAGDNDMILLRFQWQLAV